MSLRQALAAVGLAALLAACGAEEGPSADDPAEGEGGTTDAAAGEADVTEAHAELFETSYDAIVEAAAQEEVLRVCSTLTEEEFQAVRDGFYEKFPDVVELEFERCNGTEPRERILNEYAAGQVRTDVFDTSDEYYERIVEGDWAAQPDWSVFDGTDLEIQERFIASEPWGGRFVASGSWSPVMVVNTDLVAEDERPTSFKDCAEEEWRGEFMLDTRPNAFPAFLQAWGEEELREWARSAGDNDPMWTRGSGVLPQLSAGERKMHCAMTSAAVLRFIDGADGDTNIDYIIPEETAAPFSQKLMMPKDTPSPNAALLLMAFWASDEGQLLTGEINPGYGSPFVEGTWKQEAFDEAGITVHEAGWDYGTYADDATEMIVEEWGFPQPELE